MNDRDLMQQALDALKQSNTSAPFDAHGVVYVEGVKIHKAAITALSERLAHCDRCGKRLGGEGDIHTCTPDPIGDAQDRLIAELAAQPEQEPVACLSKTQAKTILGLALDLEKTGRMVVFTKGQERTDFAARNRNIQCALEDALRNATTPPAAPVRPVTEKEDQSQFYAELEYSPDWDVYACVYLRRADACPELVHREQLPRQTAAAQPTNLASVVQAHIKDLRACLPTLLGYAELSQTAAEVEKAADELEAALATPPAAQPQICCGAAERCDRPCVHRGVWLATQPAPQPAPVQPEQEPVATVGGRLRGDGRFVLEWGAQVSVGDKLYKTPPAQPAAAQRWVGKTDDGKILVTPPAAQQEPIT